MGQSLWCSKIFEGKNQFPINARNIARTMYGVLEKPQRLAICSTPMKQKNWIMSVKIYKRPMMNNATDMKDNFNEFNYKN